MLQKGTVPFWSIRQEVLYMNDYDPEYKPISALGYIGFQILYALPVIGLICVIIFSLVPRNQNVKNFARAQLIVWIIAMILVIVGTSFAVLSGITLDDLIEAYSHSSSVQNV